MAVVNFTGLASGIDSGSLISAYLEQQRTARIKPLQLKIESLTETNSSFDRLTELLNTLKSATDKFRDINGTVLAKSASSSSESRVTATASNAATNGSYSLNVTALAKNASFSFDDRYSSSTATINSSINDGAVAADRTVTVDVGTGGELETVSIELTSSSTLSDFVNEFNSQSSKAEASIVNVGTTASPSYAIVINSNNQGTSKGTLAVNVGSEITSAGSGALASNQLSQATDATFTVSGISGTITRSTNTVSDLISGVTFQLQSTGAATVTIADDPDTTTSSVSDFVEAYNAVVEYIAENDVITRDEETEATVFGPLAGTSLDENLLSLIRSDLTNSSITGGTYNTLADLGLSTQRDGTLAFDSTKFKTTLAADPESVRSITRNLGDSLAGVDGTIAQFTRFGGLIDTAKRSNLSEVDSFNKQIDSVEKYLSQQEASLQARYSRLEAAIGKLNSQQSALAGLKIG